MKREAEENGYGKYRVLNVGKRKKPTTIKYYVTCGECGEMVSFTSSPTMREKFMKNKYMPVCPHCGCIISKKERNR